MQKKVLWLFGLSGAGKSTIAQHISMHLNNKNITHILLDGDEVRSTVNKDLGFSEKDRFENIRRSAEMAKLLSQQNVLCICTFITPLKSLRNLVKTILDENVILFFIDTPIEECAKRDVKGLYKKAANQEIPDFTGVSAKFEYPDNTENTISVHTLNKTPEECAREIISFLEKNSI